MSEKSEVDALREPQVKSRNATKENEANDQSLRERLKILYPKVNETETPLPRHWSSKDKAAQIELSKEDLRANGPGSVRAAHPIPTDCPGYYFEVKIVSRSAVVGLSSGSNSGNSVDR